MERYAAEILESIPGIEAMVPAAIISEAFDSIRRADLQALRSCVGGAPVTIRSGRAVLAQHPPLGHMAAIQRDDTGRKKYRTLRCRGHKHACSLRSVAGRFPGVVCSVAGTGQAFAPERQPRGRA